MKISDYYYELPDSLIADRPPAVRGTSRLLVLDRPSGHIDDRCYSDVVEYCSPGDVVVLNDTKVIKARLKTVKENGAVRELVILEKHSFDSDWHRHRVLYHGKLSKGDSLTVCGSDHTIMVDLIEGGGVAQVRCDIDLLQLANKFGNVPLPPYMHRDAEQSDVDRYQTIWAEKAGSVAAPTASLNMTNDIIDRLKQKGVNVVRITLHVGLGTFLPIRTDNVEDHHMHQEYFEISNKAANTIRSAKNSGHKIIAVGTTVARTLEYSCEQIMCAEGDISGEADIFIYPGYNFKMIDILLTNYHAPKSTVLMLTAAFAGWDRLLPAYRHAVDEKYHFLSYGDSMLII